MFQNLIFGISFCMAEMNHLFPYFKCCSPNLARHLKSKSDSSHPESGNVIHAVRLLSDAISHHIHNLLEGQSKLEDHWIWLVGDRPLKLLVASHQVVQQPPLIGSAMQSCNKWLVASKSTNSHNLSSSWVTISKRQKSFCLKNCFRKIYVLPYYLLQEIRQNRAE